MYNESILSDTLLFICYCVVHIFTFFSYRALLLIIYSFCCCFVVCNLDQYLKLYIFVKQICICMCHLLIHNVLLCEATFWQKLYVTLNLKVHIGVCVWLLAGIKRWWCNCGTTFYILHVFAIFQISNAFKCCCLNNGHGSFFHHLRILFMSWWIINVTAFPFMIFISVRTEYCATGENIGIIFDISRCVIK